MTLRPEYSLGHSQYNDFLFAPVGEEKTGQQLTVLTLLTRLEIDPWKEAARLSDMPREKAALAFAATIGRLPEGERTAWDPQAIATRAVGCLPASSAPPVPPLSGGPAKSERKEGRVKNKPSLTRWLLWGALASAVVLLVYNLQGAHQFEPPAGSSSAAQSNRS